MSLLFKRTKIAIYLTAIISALVACYFYMPSIEVNEFGIKTYYYGMFAQNGKAESFGAAIYRTLLAGLLIALLVALVIDAIATIKHKKLLAVLYNDCDFQSFLAVYRLVAWREERLNGYVSPLIRVVKLHYARALFLKGDIEIAISFLESLYHKKRIISRQWKDLKLAALISLSMCHYLKGDKSNALICHEKAETRLGNLSKTKQSIFYPYFYICKETHDALGLLLMREDAKAQESIELNLSKNVSNFDRVCLSCLLSQTYLEIGNEVKAKECLCNAEDLSPNSFPVLQVKKVLESTKS